MENTTIENLEENLRQAMLTSDVPALDELIADDLVFTMHTGLVVNKQSDQGSASLWNLQVHEAGHQRCRRHCEADRQIHSYGDCIVVTLKAEIAGTLNHQSFSETYRFTRVWVQRQNRWQSVAGHVSQVEK